MGHRYYDSRIGRFLTQDPAGSGDNWYVYADNNPVNEVDPGGLMPLMSFPEGSSPQGVDQPVWAATENGAFREFGSGGMHTWREWYGTLSINGGPPQDFDTGIKVIGSDEYTINPYSFDFPIPDFVQRRVGDAAYHFLVDLGSLIIPVAPSGPGKGPGNNPNDTVEKILKGKNATIKQAPLEPGLPSWQDINKMQWKKIIEGAEQGKPGYGTLRKIAQRQ